MMLKQGFLNPRSSTCGVVLLATALFGFLPLEERRAPLPGPGGVIDAMTEFLGVLATGDLDSVTARLAARRS